MGMNNRFIKPKNTVDRTDYEFRAKISFTHAGVSIRSGEKFTGDEKGFTNADLDFLESRGRIVDFTSPRIEAAKKAGIAKPREVEKPVEKMENPFVEESTDTEETVSSDEENIEVMEDVSFTDNLKKTPPKKRTSKRRNR